MEKEDRRNGRRGPYTQHDQKTLAKDQGIRTGKRPVKTLTGRERIRKQAKRRVAKKEVSQGEKKVLVMEYIALGMKRDTALSVSGLTRHQYYYKPNKGKRGIAPSQVVIQHNKGKTKEVKNSVVINYMKGIQGNIDLRCGHRRMSSQLQLQGYQINHKKVYRLMKAHDLLLAKHDKPTKNYVKYRVIAPECPLSHLEMDIKFVWIQQHRRHALILSIMDIFTRRILDWHVGMSITQHTVKEVFTRVVIDHLQKNDMLSKAIHIEIRNDNDKRFSAKIVQQFFKQNYLNQVFTHPYTPEENGHIESFHKTLTGALKNQYFDSLEQLETRLTGFYDNYNNHRCHSALCGLTPYLFNQQWIRGNIQRLEMENRKVKFKLLAPKYQLSGNESLREASCMNAQHSNHNKEVSSTTTLQQPSVQRSPSVASCKSKSIIKNAYY